MKRTLQAVFLTVFAAQVLVIGQSADVKRVLADIRAALGGEAALGAVKSLTIEGQSERAWAEGVSNTQPFEMAFELPGVVKFVKRDVLANLGGTLIARRAGFNGSELIEVVDGPPGMTMSSSPGGGRVQMMRMNGGAPPEKPGTQVSPERLAEEKAQALVTNRREFARLALGMFGTTTSAYPVEYAYGGQVDGTNGKAHVIDVKAADGFAAKLYVDGATSLPLMLAWMDKEPLRVMSNAAGPVQSGGGAAGGSWSSAGGGNAGASGVRVLPGPGGAAAAGITEEEAAKMRADMEARRKEAEANRRTVEFRLYYADYKSFDGVKLPTRIQRMVDGLPSEEMSLDKIRINPKIDPARFAPDK